jgi:hypothetical protein
MEGLKGCMEPPLATMSSVSYITRQYATGRVDNASSTCWRRASGSALGIKTNVRPSNSGAEPSSMVVSSMVGSS